MCFPFSTVLLLGPFLGAPSKGLLAQYGSLCVRGVRAQHGLAVEDDTAQHCSQGSTLGPLAQTKRHPSAESVGSQVRILISLLDQVFDKRLTEVPETSCGWIFQKRPLKTPGGFFMTTEVPRGEF